MWDRDSMLPMCWQGAAPRYRDMQRRWRQAALAGVLRQRRAEVNRSSVYALPASGSDSHDYQGRATNASSFSLLLPRLGPCHDSLEGPFYLFAGPLIIYSYAVATALVAHPDFSATEQRVLADWGAVRAVRLANERREQPDAPPRLGVVYSGVAEDVFHSLLLFRSRAHYSCARACAGTRPRTHSIHTRSHSRPPPCGTASAHICADRPPAPSVPAYYRLCILRPSICLRLHLLPVRAA